jgi:hypothetical protein
MEERFDPMKSAVTIVKEAKSAGLRVDFEKEMVFAPEPVIMVLQERRKQNLAVTKDRRIWAGPTHRLAIGMVPTRHEILLGSDLRDAREKWDNHCRAFEESESGQTREND